MTHQGLRGVVHLVKLEFALLSVCFGEGRSPASPRIKWEEEELCLALTFERSTRRKSRAGGVSDGGRGAC